MGKQSRVVVFEEVFKDVGGDYLLCFQYVRYEYGDGTTQKGYRFIYRLPGTHNLQGARGQARIPSVKILKELVDEAIDAGWGDHDCELTGYHDQGI